METPTQQVCQDIMLLFGRIKQEFLRIAEAEHLTQVQFAALYVLRQRGELAMGEVAHTLHCDPSNVTGIVDRLVAHNLVARCECPSDRRAKTISLTPEGKLLVDRLVTTLPERLGCSKLTHDERAVLHNAVQKLVA